MEQFVVAYAKIIEDKDDGIHMQGVYFGGIGNTLAEAEQIARDCVNTVRGGTILPKVVRIQSGNQQVLDALCDATDRFQQTVSRMVEVDQIINRTMRRKK